MEGQTTIKYLQRYLREKDLGFLACAARLPAACAILITPTFRLIAAAGGRAENPAHGAEKTQSV